MAKILETQKYYYSFNQHQEYSEMNPHTSGGPRGRERETHGIAK